MKIILFANTDWYLYNFRLPLARAIRSRGHEVVLVSPPGEYGARLLNEGFRWVQFPVGRKSFNPFTELSAILKLVKLYRSERPDLVHHFTIKCVLYGSLAARMTGGARVVNSVTGLGHVFTDDGPAMRVMRPFVRGLYRIALKGSRVIFQNPDDLRLFESNNLLEGCEKVHLIRGSGVDVQRFVPSDRAGERQTRRVLFASRLLWTKGLGEFVEAAGIVRGRMPESVFQIAGDSDSGNPASIPRDVLDGWNRQGNVRVLGHQDNMETLLRQADVVVLPSYREGLPRILLEAAARGLPLVAADVPGCREIVRHGVNGLLVPVKDSIALAEAIMALLSDEELRAQMGRESRRVACKEFSQERVIEETLAVYDAGRLASR